VVTEITETIVDRKVVFTYGIHLDPIVAERRQLLSKYGSKIEVHMKVVCCEEEMWKDDSCLTTRVYLEGSILEIFEHKFANRIDGNTAFYAVQLDSVRAVESMFREEHPFDRYCDAYDSQAVLWQTDVENDVYLQARHTAAIESAVQNAKALSREDVLSVSSYASAHFSSPRSAANSDCEQIFEEMSRESSISGTSVFFKEPLGNRLRNHAKYDTQEDEKRTAKWRKELQKHVKRIGGVLP